MQFPISGLPRELGLKGAVFADAGTLFGYKGATTFDVNGNGIIDGFARRGCSLAHAQECIMVRDNKTSVPRSAPASCGRRRSARSASTTPSRSPRKRADVQRTASGRRRPHPGLPLLRAARASNPGRAPDGALTCSSWLNPNFFPQGQTLNLRQVAEMAHVALPDGTDGELLLRGVAPLESAGPGDLAYMDNPAYVGALAATRAGACLVTPRFAAKVPSGTVALVTPQAYRVFAQVLAVLFPSAMRPESSFAATGISPGSFVHPSARLEHGVRVDPGAVVGPQAEIGPAR